MQQQQPSAMRASLKAARPRHCRASSSVSSGAKILGLSLRNSRVLLLKQSFRRCSFALLLLLLLLPGGPEKGCWCYASDDGEKGDSLFVFKDSPEFLFQDEQQRRQGKQAVASPFSAAAGKRHEASRAPAANKGANEALQNVPNSVAVAGWPHLVPVPKKSRKSLSIVNPANSSNNPIEPSTSRAAADPTRDVSGVAAAAGAAAAAAAAAAARPFSRTYRQTLSSSSRASVGRGRKESSSSNKEGEKDAFEEIRGPSPSRGPSKRSLHLPPLPVSRFAAAAGLQQNIEAIYDSLHLFTEAAARWLSLEAKGGDSRKQQRPKRHPAVRPKYEAALGAQHNEQRRPTSPTTDSAAAAAAACSNSTGGDQQQQQPAAPLVADAWRQVKARFLNVLPVVSVDGFLISFYGLRWSRHRHTDSRKLPFATPYPGMAHLLFLVSLGPHVISEDGQPVPRVPVRPLASGDGGDDLEELKKELADGEQHAASLAAAVEEGASLWPLSPLLLSSRPSSLFLFRSVFRSSAFFAQLGELLTTASKQMLSLRCLKSHRQDCWDVGRRWTWGRRSSVSFFSTLSPEARAAEKAACVYAELLIRMNQDTKHSGPVLQRLRAALMPVYRVSVEGETVSALPAAVSPPAFARATPRPTFSQERERLLDVEVNKGLAGGASSSYRERGSSRFSPGSVTNYLASRLPFWRSRGSSGSSRARIAKSPPTPTVPSIRETAYHFYQDPSLAEPLLFFGDDSYRNLSLHLGLSLLAPHKTAAVYVHVTGDLGSVENAGEVADPHLSAFKTTRFRTETGVHLPVHTLEFDVEIVGPSESVVSVVAALTNAFSHISSSQLEAASADPEVASREGRKVRAVAVAEFKPLHLVGKALSRFVTAHLTTFRACRQTRRVRAKETRQGAAGLQARRWRRSAQGPAQQQELTVEDALFMLRAGGGFGCHLPLLILKPRFVVHRELRQAKTPKDLQVQILPVIDGSEQSGSKEEKAKDAYQGPRARQFPENARLPNHSSSAAPTNFAGIPVILFRTPVHALTQSWLFGLVERQDVFRGASKSIEDLRAFLPVADHSRFALYRDFHEDFLHMLAVTAHADELLPPAAQASALLLHLIHLRELPLSFPGAEVARTVHVDAGECYRRLLPIQLESVSWQMQPPKVPFNEGATDSLKRQKQQQEAPRLSPRSARWRNRRTKKLPLGAKEPPWGVITGVVSELMRYASRDVVSRIEQAANDLGLFFCSRLPWLHFMEAGSAPELAEFTLGLLTRLQTLKREVNAAVLSGDDGGSRRWRRPPSSSLKSNLYNNSRQKQQMGSVELGTVEGEDRRGAPVRRPVAYEKDVSDSSSGDEETENSQHASSHTNAGQKDRMGLSPSRGGKFYDRMRRRREQGPFTSRGALEVVDIQLQMQHQLLKISAGVAADITEHEAANTPPPSPEKLLLLVPQLQAQLDLEKTWTQNMGLHASKALDDDTPFGGYQRQITRRNAVSDVLRNKDKETADLAFSLMDAAEWMHALKEEGRTPRAVYAVPYPGGFQQAASAASPALLHFYRPSERRGTSPTPPEFVQRAEEDVEETLEDAQQCAVQSSSNYQKFGLSAASRGGLLTSSASAVAALADTPDSSSTKQQQLANRGSAAAAHHGLQPRSHNSKGKLWWESEATSLLIDLKQIRPASLALVPHLRLALQTGSDWDCLGEDSVEANALWLFVMGRICANGFFCEGLRSMLFGETLLIHDMLNLAKRAASGSGKPLSLTRVDVVLDGQQEGFARTYYARQQLGLLSRFFASGSRSSFPQRLFLSCTAEWQLAVETLAWIHTHPNCFMRYALP